jgi:hypothetical protein
MISGDIDQNDHKRTSRERRGKARCLKPQRGIEPIGRCGGGARGYNKEPKNPMSVTLASQKSGMRGRRGKPVMVMHRWTGHASLRLSKFRVFTTPNRNEQN